MTILTKELVNSLKAPNVISIAQSQVASLIVPVDVMNLTNRPTGKIDRCCQASPVSDFAKVVARADLIVDGQFQILGMQRLALIVSSQQAKEVFALAKEKGLYCSAYQNRRYDSDFLTVQKVIESGKLGDLLELEMHFDYYRPEIPESVDHFDPAMSYLYGHGCHTLDQVISYFGKPNDIHYDVRQLLGSGRMNDYFDLDLYYGTLKVSVKSSYFRVKSRPSFIVYGKKGMFEKYSKDRQEEHLKLFHMPTNSDFGKDLPEHYGTLTYYDDEGIYHEEKVPTVDGDYARVYDGIYDSIVYGKEQVIQPWQTILQMEMLETGVKDLK